MHTLQALVRCAVLCVAGAAISQTIPNCDIVIAGGSAASLAAAIAAANSSISTQVCFLEATDWPGGQMTASAVSAIDFGSDNREPLRNTANFARAMWNSTLPTDNTCWVSVKCFQPQLAEDIWIMPTLASLPNLAVFLNTVVVGVQQSGSGVGFPISSLQAIQRTPVPGTTGWEALLSAQVEDWYSPADSPLFTKSILNLPLKAGSVVIEATEFGDVFGAGALAMGQGMETNNENDTTYIDYCGQGTTFDFYMSYGEQLAPSPDPWPPGSGEGAPFSLGNKTTPGPDLWTNVWTYRRSMGVANTSLTKALQGETSLQNWAGGNDFDTGYLFLPLAETRAQVPWKGGLNMTSMAAAEQRAYGWYHAYKALADPAVTPYLAMNTTMSGTPTGLAKMPYLRDSRRAAEGIAWPSQGLGTFRLTHEALNSSNRPEYPNYGTYWNDTIAIGQYNSDIHEMEKSVCPTPAYLKTGISLPYYLPFRALTHSDVPNLLVAGKSMAQSFWANAATRLHPEEWSTGSAAGTAAGLMVENGWTTADVLGNIWSLQSRLMSESVGQPLKWDTGLGAAV